ncbi:MAG: cation:proton antiporter [Planctomycetes bacterium]|nr:cation:proton antiporter [Planctomycetota bacterium]
MIPFLQIVPLPLLSSGGSHALINDIGICLLVAGILSVIFTKLKIPTIAAFLVAGVLVGPVISQLVTDQDNINTIAQLGLMLLLFLIGLEIDIRKLMASGKPLIITGLLQFPLCVAFGFAVTLALQQTGWGALQGKYVPLYVGFTLAASSTLIAVKLFQQHLQLDTLVGRVSLGVLIFQDIWSIVVLAAQPNLADPQLGTVALTFLDIALLTVFAVVVAKYVLPHAFKWIAKIPELMLVAATAWCFGIGFLGANMGKLLGIIPGVHLEMSTSMEMGALIAGASIASLPYSTEVVTKVSNVRDFFVTLFFVGLGMGIPKPDGVEVLLLALVFGALCVISRYLVFFPLMYFTGMDRRHSMVAATRLAQISEFCLVIAYLGLSFGHVDKPFVSAVIFAFVITALVTPLMFNFGDKLHDSFGGLLTRFGFKPPSTVTRMLGSRQADADVVLLGFFRVASALYYHIEKNQPEMLKHLKIVDFNVNIHAEIHKRGAQVAYGDISNIETLHHAGLDKARIIFCTIPDDVLKGTTNTKLCKALRHISPKAKIITTAINMKDAAAQYEAGADYVSIPRLDVARNLARVLEAAMTDTLEAVRLEDAERGEDPLKRDEVLK